MVKGSSLMVKGHSLMVKGHSLIVKGNSLMVKHSAHNGSNSGSTPLYPNNLILFHIGHTHMVTQTIPPYGGVAMG